MSDFLERNGLQTVAQHFKDLFLAASTAPVRRNCWSGWRMKRTFSRPRREPSTTALSPVAWLFTA